MLKKLLGILGLHVFMLLSVSFNTDILVPYPKGSGNLQPLNDSIVYPQNYFKSPLDIPLTLAGNFGEPRRLHFHTGLDFRTNQMEGLKVYAPADGYVSRIKVEGAGYGNALYITHTNGWVTVYGHLQKFSEQIMQRLRKEQYGKESFAVDFKLSPNEIPVKQGDIVALSGNTGGSGGPHLHFEIRDSLDNIYNPMLFGYKLKDNIKPTVSGMKFYAMDDDLKYSTDGYRSKVQLVDGIYGLPLSLLKVNTKHIGFSVHTYDKLEGTENYIGIYNMTVFDNDKMVYQYQIDKISFPEKRCVLSHIDYPVFLAESRKSLHKCYVEPGNSCQVYGGLVNGGIIDLSDGKPHNVHIEISDFSGNVSQIDFKLEYDATSTLFKPKSTDYDINFQYDKPNSFSNADFRVDIPKGLLFDNVFARYTPTLATEPGIYSKVHQFGNSDIQTYDWFNVAIKAEGLPENLKEKAVIMYKDKAGAKACRGGRYENGFMMGKGREFGQYYITVDTTAPRITAVNITPGRNMRKYGKIQLKITDGISGIIDFDTYLNGQWVVTTYDAKNALLTFPLSGLAAGEHTYKLVVEDERHNKSEYSVKFVW